MSVGSAAKVLFPQNWGLGGKNHPAIKRSPKFQTVLSCWKINSYNYIIKVIVPTTR